MGKREIPVNFPCLSIFIRFRRDWMLTGTLQSVHTFRTSRKDFWWKKFSLKNSFFEINVKLGVHETFLCTMKNFTTVICLLTEYNGAYNVLYEVFA